MYSRGYIENRVKVEITTTKVAIILDGKEGGGGSEIDECRSLLDPYSDKSTKRQRPKQMDREVDPFVSRVWSYRL